MGTTASSLQVDYFDGLTARAHPVRMWMENGMLQLSGQDLIRQVPLDKVQWPERTRHGLRMAHFEDGGSVQCADAAAWDDWCRAHNLAESMVVKAQQSWRLTLVATALLLMVMVLAYVWGLPLAARALTPLIPIDVDQRVGSAAFAAIDARWLRPSKLSSAEQARLRARFHQAIEQHEHLLAADDGLAQTGATAPVHGVPIQLHFRQGPIGPNALALPDGSIVVTDELIELLQDREDALLGVIGHELAHVRLRHAMRSLIQTGLLSAAASVLLGDFSSVLAAAPAALGHMAYSRVHEREADEAAIAFMRHNDIRPSSMAVLFERLAVQRADKDEAGATEPAGHADRTPLGIAFSSHPSDAERIAFFKAADVHPAARAASP